MIIYKLEECLTCSRYACQLFKPKIGRYVCVACSAETAATDIKMRSMTLKEHLDSFVNYWQEGF